MTYPDVRRRARWFGLAALLAGLGLIAGCTAGLAPPQVLGPAAWHLTVSPIEPAAGIPAEVTVQRIDAQGRALRATPEDVPPHARARELASNDVIWAGPALVDGRGLWVAPIVFPAIGRWQVVLHEAIDPRVPIRENVRLPWPSIDRFGPEEVVRDAVGREDLTLLITVITDRGPLLWWLRTHLLQVAGVALVLTASVVSYFVRRRLLSRSEDRVG